MNAYTVFNTEDLLTLGSSNVLGNPLIRMIRPELGDKLHEGEYKMGSGIDDFGTLVETTPERAAAIVDGLGVITNARKSRKIRHQTYKNMPNRAF